MEMNVILVGRLILFGSCALTSEEGINYQNGTLHILTNVS